MGRYGWMHSPLITRCPKERHRTPSLPRGRVKLDSSGLPLHQVSVGCLERSTGTSLLLPRLTDQEVIGLEKFINVGACCSFLVGTVLISRDLQVMRTSLFLFAVFFFLAPGKTSTLAGKVIGGGDPERGSVSVSSRAQLALECCDPPRPRSPAEGTRGYFPLMPLLEILCTCCCLGWAVTGLKTS